MIEFHAENWMPTLGGLNSVAIVRCPVELPRHQTETVEEIKRRGFTIDGKSYELVGVGCPLINAPIRAGEGIELLVVGGPKRAEPVNEHAKRLMEAATRFSPISLECIAAAAEIERLAALNAAIYADRDGWLKQAEIQAESLRESNAEVERLAARVRELEAGPSVIPEAKLRPAFAMTNPPRFLGYDVQIDGKTIAVVKAEESGRSLAFSIEVMNGRADPQGPPESKPDQETKGER